MKTLEECKLIIAVKNGFGPCWDRIDPIKRIGMVDQLCRLYAKEVSQNCLNRAFEGADIDADVDFRDGMYVQTNYVIKESITETEILLP